MYVHRINSRKNFISLSKLLKNSPNDKLGNVVETILGAEILSALGKQNDENLPAATISRIENGDDAAAKRYKECAKYLAGLAPEKFTEHCERISDFWAERQENLTAQNANGAKISVVEALKFLVNGDDFGDCPNLRVWLNSALSNGKKYLAKVLSVATILAITRGNWEIIAKNLSASGFLETISDFPHYADYDRFASGREFTPDAQRNSWNAYVYWRRYQSEHDANSLNETKNCLNAALEHEKDEICKKSLEKWRREVEEKILENLIADAKTNKNSEPLEEYLKNLQERAWYGYACWRVSELFDALGENCKREEYLDKGVKRNEPHAICRKMNDLISAPRQPLPSDEGLKLAKKLAQMQTFPPLRGEAFYRLYEHTGDENYLRNAYRCGFQKAVKEYRSRPVETLERADYEKAGRCFLNVDMKNPVAQILAATIPESWKIHYELEGAELKCGGEEILMYLFAKADATQNIQDFIQTLAKLKNADLSCAMFFIRGEEELLRPIVDSILQQWAGANQPTIRVQILDDAKRAAQELFGRHPLFYSLWAKQKVGESSAEKVGESSAEKVGESSAAMHLILVGEGKTTPWLLRESSWLLTAVPKAKISLMSPHAESLIEGLKQRYDFSGEIKMQPFNVSENQLIDLNTIAQAVIDNDALYFVVDTGESDLKNAEIARRLREIYIRAWLKNGKTAEPIVAPIAVYCEDSDISFALHNSIVFGILHGESWYNSHKFICYGDLKRYTWKNLVNDTFEMIGVNAHMIYSKIQSAFEYLAAFEDYASFTYNQDSSVAVAVSLPYRLWLLSQFDSKIIPDDWDITDGDTFFAPEKFLEHDAVSNLEDFYNSLERLYNELQRMWERLQSRKVRESEAHWKNCVVGTAAELAGLLENLSELIPADCKKIDAAIKQLREIRSADIKQNAEITGTEFDNLRNNLQSRIVEIQDNKIRPLRKNIEKIFAWEHKRWSAFMISRGWQTATVADAKKYIAAGNKRQQCHIAKVHPCIIPYTQLDNLAEDLEDALGTRKPFKKNDITSIFATKYLLEETFFLEAPEFIKDLFAEMWR